MQILFDFPVRNPKQILILCFLPLLGYNLLKIFPIQIKFVAIEYFIGPRMFPFTSRLIWGWGSRQLIWVKKWEKKLHTKIWNVIPLNSESFPPPQNVATIIIGSWFK